MATTQIHIGGVPEHFNMPWHLAIDNGDFSSQNIDLHWTDYSTGTGAMCKDLNEGKLDMAIVLTEGAVADIAKGGKIKILQWYVKSPLVWGIHVAANSAIKTTEQISGKKYGISRMGSGSHLMAFVDCSQRNIALNEGQLVIVNNMDGAAEALASGKADLFMWEKLMTKPLVDKGIFRRIGECPTPWPSFVLVVSDKFLSEQKTAVEAVQQVINNAAKNFKTLANREELISSKYQLPLEDVRNWIKTVEWSENSSIEKEKMQLVIDTLFKLKLIESKVPFETLLK